MLIMADYSILEKGMWVQCLYEIINGKNHDHLKRRMLTSNWMNMSSWRVILPVGPFGVSVMIIIIEYRDRTSLLIQSSLVTFDLFIFNLEGNT